MTTLFHKTLTAVCLLATAAVSSAMLSSCQKDTVSGSRIETPAIVSISIASDNTLSTKATDIESDQEERISSMQVFVFRQDGNLDAYAKGTSGTLEISCTAGPRTIYALVNAPDLTTVSTLDGFEKSGLYLIDESIDAFQMIGGTNAELYTGLSLEVPVKRLVAKVSIESITTNFSSDVYKNTDFTINSIYLVNATGDAKISDYAILNPTLAAPSIFYNKCKETDDVPGLLCDLGIGESIENLSTYSTIHSFYCYPNPTQDDSTSTVWSPRYTRLVVEATLGGVKYYYPISIPNIQSNRTYTIKNLTITRPGSLSADEPVTKAECTVTATVDEWSVGIEQTEEI